MDIDTLGDAEVLCAGPPCQPFSSEGCQTGALDPRSNVTDELVNWIVHLAWKGSLVIFVLENSPCILTNQVVFRNGYLDMVQQRLELLLPFFVIDFVILPLIEMIPHSRTRLFLRGMRRDACRYTIPSPLRIPQLASLINLLDRDLPNVLPSQLTTPPKVLSYGGYLAKIRSDIAAGIAGALAVFDIDRKADGVRKGKVSYDHIQSLKCKGPALFIISTHDIALRPEAQEFHRYVSNRERYVLLGQDPTYNDLCKNSTLSVRLTGNACSPLQIGAVLLPMIETAVLAGALCNTGPARLSKQSLLELAPSKRRRIV